MPIKPATKEALEAFVDDQGFTLTNSDALENKQEWVIRCPDCDMDFPLRVDSVKQCCYNNKKLVCPGCKHAVKLANFRQANNVTLQQPNVVTCNACQLSYRYSGNYFRPFHCYCGLSGRQHDAALFRGLSPHHDHGNLAKELVYTGSHRCDLVIYRDDTTIFVEVDDQGHFFGQRAQKDRGFVADFIENRKDNEFLLRIDARLVTDDLETLVTRIRDWKPQKPVTLAHSGTRFRYHYLNLEDENFELLP